tara:strand:+ start:212 stop:370 length:159 start_codon:yes stop_codon:yes gene_type:complete
MGKYVGTDFNKDYMFITRNKKTLIKTHGKEKIETTENSIIHEMMKKTWEGYE